MHPRPNGNAHVLKRLAQTAMGHVLLAHHHKGLIFQQLRCQHAVARQRVPGRQRDFGFKMQRVHIKAIMNQGQFTNANLEQARRHPFLHLGGILRLKRNRHIRAGAGEFGNDLGQKAKGNGMLRGHLQLPRLLVLQIAHGLGHVI